jgi:hypothetical protein
MEWPHPGAVGLEPSVENVGACRFFPFYGIASPQQMFKLVVLAYTGNSSATLSRSLKRRFST